MRGPATRPRRQRATPALREAMRETRLLPSHLVLPLFVRHGERQRTPIPSMPGQFQLSVDEVVKDARRAWGMGIRAVILFGIPRVKGPSGPEAHAAGGIVQRAIRALKKALPDLVVMADLCLCEYTDHGHCGVVRRRGGRVDVDNDATLPLLVRTALAQARAGADYVAPSGMMDGAVAAIRAGLDRAGFTGVGILAYSAKYASVFYGPFRDAAGSTPRFGDRRSYQMDPANIREGLRELRLDVQQGADMVMVKPALSYLDVIARIRPELDVPLVAYNVSGEYAMVRAAEERGWLGDGRTHAVAREILTSIRRAGADLIITYHALDVAPLLA